MASSLFERENIARGRTDGGAAEEAAAAMDVGETAAEEDAEDSVGDAGGDTVVEEDADGVAVEEGSADGCTSAFVLAPHRFEPAPLAVGSASARAALVTTGLGELGGEAPVLTWPRIWKYRILMLR